MWEIAAINSSPNLKERDSLSDISVYAECAVSEIRSSLGPGQEIKEGRKNKFTPELFVLHVLVSFPNMPATIYFSEFSYICFMSLPRVFGCIQWESKVECAYSIFTGVRTTHSLLHTWKPSSVSTALMKIQITKAQLTFYMDLDLINFLYSFFWF